MDVVPPNNNLFIYFHCAPDENDRPSEQTVLLLNCPQSMILFTLGSSLKVNNIVP